MGLDGPESGSAVGAGAREDHADGSGPLLERQRLEKTVDCRRRPVLLVTRLQPDATVLDQHVAISRQHIDVIGQRRVTVAHFPHRHRGGRREQPGEFAMVGGREMRKQHKRHAAVGRKRGEQAGEGLDAAGGGADSHHPCCWR